MSKVPDFPALQTSHLDKNCTASRSRKHVQEKEIGQYSYSKHCYLVLAAVEAVSAPVAVEAVRSRSQQE